MISTLVFDEETQKRSASRRTRDCRTRTRPASCSATSATRRGRRSRKSKGNYTPPEVILDRVRWSSPCSTTRPPGVNGEAGVALIAREDLEGLDLAGGRQGRSVYPRRISAGTRRSTLTRAGRTRSCRAACVVLAEEDRAALGAGADRPRRRREARRGARACRRTSASCSRIPTTPAPGADAFRWFFYASSPPWTNTRHSLSQRARAAEGLPGQAAERLLVLHHLREHRRLLARRGQPGSHRGRPWLAIRKSQGWREPERAHRAGPLDPLRGRSSPCATSTAHLDGYHVYEAAQRLVALVDALSNWYLRRSRDRFWAPGPGARTSCDAYFTLYEALTAIAAMSAPFIPVLRRRDVAATWCAARGRTSQPESVHLGRFPDADARLIDEGLAAEMGAVRELVSPRPPGPHRQPPQGAPAAVARGRHPRAPELEERVGRLRGR